MISEEELSKVDEENKKFLRMFSFERSKRQRMLDEEQAKNRKEVLRLMELLEKALEKAKNYLQEQEEIWHKVMADEFNFQREFYEKVCESERNFQKAVDMAEGFPPPKSEEDFKFLEKWLFC